MENSKMSFWGYLHVNGTVQVKCYFGPDDLDEALSSDFVITVSGPDKFESMIDAVKHYEGVLL